MDLHIQIMPLVEYYKKTCTIATICIWIIVLSFAITLHTLCICTICVTLVSWDKPLKLQSGLTQLGLSILLPTPHYSTW